jgi:hypothetical protein
MDQVNGWNKWLVVGITGRIEVGDLCVITILDYEKSRTKVSIRSQKVSIRS